MAHRKPHVPLPPERLKDSFSISTFEKLADDLNVGRLPLSKVIISDNIVTGLRAIIRKTGSISYHVTYEIGGSRPFLKLGEHRPHQPHHPSHLTLNDARELAKVVQTLARRGIDPQEGLHDRLVRELKAKGTAWRP